MEVRAEMEEMEVSEAQLDYLQLTAIQALKLLSVSLNQMGEVLGQALLVGME